MANEKLSNMQGKQDALDLSPADGGEGYVGSNTGDAPGFAVVSGKKGYVQSSPIWSRQSTGDDQDMAAPATSFGGQDPTDEKASYKRVQTDEGLPQTYRTAKGAGDAGMTGSDEPDQNAVFGKNADGGGNPDTQSIPSATAGDHAIDMPQTEFTSNDGGGAPLFKRGR